MSIEPGQKITEQTIRLIDKNGSNDVESPSVFDGKTVIVVGVPGAFTPTCTDNHIPGYLENADALFARGVDHIVVLTVNDHHVTRAWSDRLGAGDRLLFIADWDARFVKSLGLDIDLGVAGLGVRAKRFSLLVKDGEVAHLHIEDSPGVVTRTGAEHMLDEL